MRKRILLLLLLPFFLTGFVNAQSFDVGDLITLSTLPNTSVGHFMNKKGFIISDKPTEKDTVGVTYIIKVKRGKKDTSMLRSINMYEAYGSKYFILHTLVPEDFTNGKSSLIKSGFFNGDKKDTGKISSSVFQKGSISIQAFSEITDSITHYTFTLRNKIIPDSIRFAEDLLQFDSHEYLVSYFGEKNVKKDRYFFSEKELRKCSVIFSGTRRQVLFVWGDQQNLNNLEYIIVTNELPTEGAAENNPLSADNVWKLKNGIHTGIQLRDLLRINEMDFYIYGNKSQLAFMVLPEVTGKIDFKQTEIMLSCKSCSQEDIFNQKEVSALDVAKANLQMRVNDIIYPAHN